MATTIQFVVYGKPASRGSKTPWNPRRKDGSLVLRQDGRPVIATMDSDKRSKEWMQEIKSAAVNAYGGELLSGPVILTCKFFFARPKSHFGSGRNANVLKDTAPEWHTQKPDLSKTTRAIEDALTGIVWRDDSQIVGYGRDYGKYWTDTQSRVAIEIREIEV